MRELLTEVNDYDLCVMEFLRVVDMLLPVKFHRLCPELAQPEPNNIRHAGAHSVAGLIRNGWRKMLPVRWILPTGSIFNCGCPSKLVNGSGGGATLAKDPELIYRGAKAMREAVPSHLLKVTVKVRLGWDSDARQFEIADAVQQAGATELVAWSK